MKPPAQLQTWWQSRNRRERLMVAVMLASIAAFALWFGLLWPARALRDAARDGYDRAALQLREAQGSAAQVAMLQQAAPDAPPSGSASRTLLDSAAAAGIGISRQRQDGSDRFVIEIDSVPPQLLFEWLDTVRQAHGLAPRALEVERVGAGVRASLAFPSATP